MSHMPHSHDIVGPGTARGTSHSQDLLLRIAHMALEPAGQEERRGRMGQTPPFSTWLGFPIVFAKGQKQKLSIYFVVLSSWTDLSGEKLLIETCRRHIQSSVQSFPLVRCCLSENNNLSTGPSFKQSNRPLEGQSDQIDLWLQ